LAKKVGMKRGVCLGVALLPLWALALLSGFPALETGATRTSGHRGSTAQQAHRLPDRVRAASARYLGTPYARDPLGEGCGPDADPLYDRRRVDCVTFVEQALAEALAPCPDAVLPTLLRIRYHQGRVAYACRNHHFVADWLPHNAWLVRDVTEAVGGARVRRMTKRIDQKVLTTGYVPRAEVPAVLSRLPDVAIAVLVQNRPGIFAAHTGFLLRDGNAITLRHASQHRGKVVDEPLCDYLQRAPARIVGLKVLALRPDGGGDRGAKGPGPNL
jgi:hypothetical protein